MIKGFVIGATGSGTGKTTLTLAILAWLRARGMTVAPFKVGPDFIDPGHHARIAGRTSYNLDSWMLSKAYNRRLFHEQSRGADLAVVEGAMGLFDGYDAITESGSTAQMAKWLDLPVLLVVSAKGKARSAAAVVKGFETFDPDLTLAGVVFTFTGSKRHYAYLKDAVEQTCTTPCLGHLPRNDAIVMPERHLGLTTAEEHVILPAVIDSLVSLVNQGLDMDRLIANLLDPAKRSESIKNENMPKPGVGKERAGLETSAESQTAAGSIAKSFSKTPRIAVARDKAFCFYYPDNLAMLENAGACLVFFSPLTDDSLPEDIDGLYLGGGYPELFADRLSQKPVLLSAVKIHSRQGMPIYGECGGFMFLCKALWPKDHDQPVAMAGCFDLEVRMSGRLRSLGYREIFFAQDTVIGARGARVRGHEFHYSSVVSDKAGLYDNVFDVTSRAGQDVQVQGYQIGQTLGSYLHVHFGSNPDIPRCFVENCRKFRKQRRNG
ncbi:MAG: cobyrinate a,c-diamide synthase [Desulfotignum sp.]|nr:cobyrinate a,c-diamide synthase [Desulfotignum sp.]